MIRNAKFLPVMNGKKSDDATIRQINGRANTDAIATPRRIFSRVIMVPSVSRTHPLAVRAF
jgi:hypothetical protein